MTDTTTTSLGSAREVTAAIDRLGLPKPSREAILGISKACRDPFIESLRACVDGNDGQGEHRRRLEQTLLCVSEATGVDRRKDVDKVRAKLSAAEIGTGCFPDYFIECSGYRGNEGKMSTPTGVRVNLSTRVTYFSPPESRSFWVHTPAQVCGCAPYWSLPPIAQASAFFATKAHSAYAFELSTMLMFVLTLACFRSARLRRTSLLISAPSQSCPYRTFSIWSRTTDCARHIAYLRIAFEGFIVLTPCHSESMGPFP